MSKRQVLGCRRGILILRALAVLFQQVGESEGLECVGVFIERFVIVYRSGSYNRRGAFWHKRAV